MKRAACRAAALASCFALLAQPASAWEVWTSDDGETALELSGSVRELFSVSESTSEGDFQNALAVDLAPPPGLCATAATFDDCPAFALVGEYVAVQSLTRLRTRVDLSLPHGFSALVVYDHELDLGHIDTLENRVRRGFEGDTLFGAEGIIASSQHAEWAHRLYRGVLRFDRDPLLLQAGRQRIAWGVGRLWNPIDRLNPIGPLAIEADQSPGIDALDLRLALGALASLELVYAPARDSEDDRYAARLEATLFDTDIGIVGGYFQENPTFGFDLARNLGDAAARVEVVWTDPERAVWPIGAAAPFDPDPYWQLVLSVDNNFELGTGLYVLVEHLYNGNALGFGSGLAGPLLPLFEENAAGMAVPASTAVFGGSQVVSGARHQTGLQLGYDVTPELRAEVLTILDWSGTSAIFFPTLRYSPSGSLELTVGLQAGAGPHLSQYGGAGVLGYLLADFFF